MRATNTSTAPCRERSLLIQHFADFQSQHEVASAVAFQACHCAASLEQGVAEVGEQLYFYLGTDLQPHPTFHQHAIAAHVPAECLEALVPAADEYFRRRIGFDTGKAAFFLGIVFELIHSRTCPDLG